MADMDNHSAKQLARQCAGTWKLGPDFAGWLDFFETDTEDVEAAFASYRSLRKHSGPTMDIGQFWSEYLRRTTKAVNLAAHDPECEVCNGTGLVHIETTSPVSGLLTEYATPCPQTDKPRAVRKAICGMCQHEADPCAWCRDDIKTGTVKDWTTTRA